AALDGERRPYWMVRKIARYIGENMEYELAGGWNIAPTVIDRGTGSCSEYTFVFIAMCRAAGIPARYAGALVIRGDNASTDDVFHRWAEVYLPGYGWVPADAQAADNPSPEKQGEGLGSLANRFVITTWGGGDSKYIGWDYNSKATWTCEGRCQVDDLHLADWYPADKRKK
ncbi:MAG: transglutaminase domain-containing protein, partial [Deltaproteobacteria bacterium]|nr:transglutaminase domain-containing protein [Deltaproteobacteria bacterium]